MRRREFIRLLGAAATTWPLVARAQQEGKLRTIGFLGADASSFSPWTAAFVARLRELGWIEDLTIAVEYRWSEGRVERYTEIAAEFVRLNVDVIVTGSHAVPAARQATSVIPIVFVLALDPVGAGLVASLARPGGNVTGLSPAFEALKAQADALYVAQDALVAANRTRILTLALSAQQPTIFGTRDFVQAGALMSYGPNFPDQFRRAAELVDKILRGAKPADLPVEQPTKFELVINLATAKALGLTVPPTVLARADEVIK
jgi:putative tryptophan/tyrosine transport system substrate-binding protein